MKKSEEDLKSVAGDIVYEATMLMICTVELSKINAAKNAYLESFLIHFRNLRDFLDPENPHPDDILAEHYFENWKAKKPPINEFWSKTREKLNKLVAHLSYKRAELAKDKDWPVDDMCRDVMKVWTVFLNNLSEDKRQWFEQKEKTP